MTAVEVFAVAWGLKIPLTLQGSAYAGHVILAILLFSAFLALYQAQKELDELRARPRPNITVDTSQGPEFEPMSPLAPSDRPSLVQIVRAVFRNEPSRNEVGVRADDVSARVSIFTASDPKTTVIEDQQGEWSTGEPNPHPRLYPRGHRFVSFRIGESHKLEIAYYDIFNGLCWTWLGIHGSFVLQVLKPGQYFVHVRLLGVWLESSDWWFDLAVPATEESSSRRTPVALAQTDPPTK